MKIHSFLKAAYILPFLYIIAFVVAFLLGQFTSLGECSGEGFLCFSKAFVIVVTINAPGILVGGILNITMPLIIGVISILSYALFGHVIDSVFHRFRELKELQ